MSRMTVKDLRIAIAEVNGWLHYEGCDTRLEEGGRNGYQAVDCYRVDAEGNRIGSYRLRNICCGTSRECVNAAYAYWRDESSAKDNQDLRSLRKFADSVGRTLDMWENEDYREDWAIRDISSLYEKLNRGGFDD